jgi:hypothetical protein
MKIRLKALAIGDHSHTGIVIMPTVEQSLGRYVRALQILSAP